MSKHSVRHDSGVTSKGVSGWDQHSNWGWLKQIALPNVVGTIQSVKGLNRTEELSKKEITPAWLPSNWDCSFFPAFGLELKHQFFLGLQLPLPCRSRDLQALLTVWANFWEYISVSVYASYGFCSSREPRAIHPRFTSENRAHPSTGWVWDNFSPKSWPKCKITGPKRKSIKKIDFWEFFL